MHRGRLGTARHLDPPTSATMKPTGGLLVQLGLVAIVAETRCQLANLEAWVDITTGGHQVSRISGWLTCCFPVVAPESATALTVAFATAVLYRGMTWSRGWCRQGWKAPRAAPRGG